jgi:predicted dienelactone hydrolase
MGNYWVNKEPGSARQKEEEMSTIKRICLSGCVFLLVTALPACSPASAVKPTMPEASTVEKKASPSIQQATAAPAEMPLSGFGEYAVGIRRQVAFKDESRGGREVALTIWYPAAAGSGEPGSVIPDAAAPEFEGAPFPVILSSSKVGFVFASSLVSHGFTWIGVNAIDTYAIWDANLIDQPLDLLFALKMVAEKPPEGLEGVIDTDNAGAMGYSFDGYNALALSGARVDPQAYLERCAAAEKRDPPYEDWYVEYLCTIAKDWPAFEAHAGQEMTESADGLWQPMADARIKAVMPMGPDGAWLFNEHGLAAADKPVFFINAEKEEFYMDEVAYMYDHIGSKEKYLVTFIGREHLMVYDRHALGQMEHFANAFFGYALQGREDYKAYFSEDFVRQYPDLAWGVYQSK